MFWALAWAGLVLELPKSLAVTINVFFMVYDQNYFNCSTLVYMVSTIYNNNYKSKKRFLYSTHFSSCNEESVLMDLVD
jgi:hypothetical protein